VILAEADGAAWPYRGLALDESPYWKFLCVDHRLNDGVGIEIFRGRRMFFYYFNKLGWFGSILVSIVLTLVLILAFRLNIG
jgi:hypothetical protein